MEEKRFCSQCGNELAENAKFCNRCGAPVPPRAEEPAKPGESIKSGEPAAPAGGSGQGGGRQRLLLILLIVVAAVAVAAIVGFFVMRGKYQTAIASQQEVLEEEVTEEDLEEEIPEEILVEEETEPEEEVVVEETPEEDLEVEEVTTEDVSAQGHSAEARQAAEELFSNLIDYSVNDVAKFEDLFIGATDDDVQAAGETFAELYAEHYDKIVAAVAVDADPYYFVQACTYTVAGTYPDASMKDHYVTFAMKDTASGWKIDFSEEAGEILNETENLSQAYPSGYMEAASAGRNCAYFGPCFLWVDETAVFEDDFDQELFFLWQNEDGSVEAGVWYGNGTDGAISVSELSLTVTDDALGTVLDGSGSVSEMVSAGYGKLIIYHFEASEVLTGTSGWSSMSSHISVTTKG